MGNVKSNAELIEAKVKAIDRKLNVDRQVIDKATGEMVTQYCLRSLLAQFQGMPETRSVKAEIKKLSRAIEDLEDDKAEWNDPIEGPARLEREQRDKLTRGKIQNDHTNREIEIQHKCPFLVKRVLRNMLEGATGHQYSVSLVSEGEQGEMLYNGVDALELVDWQGESSKAYKRVEAFVKAEEQVA